MKSTTTKKRCKPTKAKLIDDELVRCSHLNTTGSDNSFLGKEPRRVPSLHKVSSPSATLSSRKRKDHCLHQAMSLGFTDFAATLADDSRDPDEVDSMLNNTSLVKVDEYKVKKEIAPLLKAILDKQGNIAKHCVFETTPNRSSLLEHFCSLYKTIENKDPKTVKISEVNSMLVEVRDFENAGLDVKWLKERLDEIANTLEKSKGYSVMKKEVEMKNKDAKRKRKELEELKEKTRVTENELAAIEAKVTDLSEQMSSTKAKWESICGQSLVKGLL